MITIDGSTGEGGGQILRGSLALAAVTGTPFRIDHIRARRERPGLMRQHLTAVRAAQRVSNARVVGDEIGSQTLEFHPGPRAAGVFELNIGSAGSTSLVLQAILPALATLDAPSVVVLEGGTHNPLAPPAEFFEQSLLPQLRRIGWNATITLERHGFYPAGGGKVRIQIAPCETPQPFELLTRGEKRFFSTEAMVANLSRQIGERELAVLKKRLNFSDDRARTVESDGPGNVVSVTLAFEHVCERISAFGERGVSAEKVAANAADEALAYLKSDAPVGPHLCDQLLLPLALAKGGRFRTTEWTPHSESQKDLLALFLGTRVTVDGDLVTITTA